MPDPVLYLKASLAVVIASTWVVLAFRLIIGKSARSFSAAIGVLATGAGLVVGYTVLQFTWTWPPANGLNRLLFIVLPATAIVELLAAVLVDRDRVTSPHADQQCVIPEAQVDFREQTPFRRPMIILRLVLYAAAGRILLHESVYLTGNRNNNPDAWTSMQTFATLSGGFAGLIVIRTLLYRLSARDASCSITISLAMAILCAGVTTMMAGYIKGGVAAFPLAAALAGTTLAAPLFTQRCVRLTVSYFQGINGIGLIGLFGLVSIGHYFGQLTGPRAIVLLLAPLLCWISELPGLRLMPSKNKLVIRLTAVVILLATVINFAKRDFDAKMAPLMAVVTATDADERFLHELFDLTTAGGCRPNQFRGDIPEEWKTGELEAWEGTDWVCPSVPEGRQALMVQWEEQFSRTEDHEILRFYAGDPGGCRCPRCEPWGRTFVELSEEEAAIGRKYHGETVVEIASQDLSNAGDRAIFD